MRADLAGARNQPLEYGLKVGLAGDLAGDVADDAAQPHARNAQLPAMAVELLGVGVAPRHHDCVLGDAQVGLPQPYPMPTGQAIEILDRRVQELDVDRESVLGCTVVSNVTRARPKGAKPCNLKSAKAAKTDLCPVA